MNKLNDCEVRVTKYLCDAYGYGHIMDLVSALWRRKLAEDGLPTNAAFIPTIETFIRGEHIRSTKCQARVYDKLVDDYFKEKTE